MDCLFAYPLHNINSVFYFIILLSNMTQLLPDVEVTAHVPMEKPSTFLMETSRAVELT
jgi:hypothetical protein